MTMTTDVVEAVAAKPLAIVKVVVLTVLAVVFLGLAGSTWYLFTEVKETSSANATLKEANTSLQHDLELVKVGQASMLLGQVMSDQQKEALDKKVRDTRNALKQKEIAIDKSEATPEEKARMKSEARMTSVWDNYCFIQPNNAICKTQATNETRP